MSTFATPAATPAALPPDPSKHVNYTLGMVLGVDDFTQEFAYLDGRTEWLARDVLGYGTVCGLKISVDSDARGPRVSVTPGTALSISGQLIYVTASQCAYLNDWLAANQSALMDLGASPPKDLRLYVVLSYAEAQTDQVPIPGEPCRTESESMAASRIADCFSLNLSLTWPQQTEEHEIREFVNWLAQIEISDDPGAFTALADFENDVRAALAPWHVLSPPLHSPPQAIRIHSADVCEYLRAAFRIWATELRPQYHTTGPTPPANDQGVLLAEITVPVVVVGTSNTFRVDDRFAPSIDESQRPVLIHLRMLQEYLLCGKCDCATVTSGPAVAPGNTVQAATAFGIAAASGAAATFSRSDHTHGTPPDPIPAHKADPNAHSLSGDVTGVTGNAVVARLQKTPVDPTAPADGQMLAFSAGSWRPTAVPSAPGSANSVTAATAFGLAAAAGSNNNYSRADHTHGTPPDPIPPHKADPNGHPLVGDVTGSVGASVVSRIQGFTVPVPSGADKGQVLTFGGAAWELQLPAAGGSGPVVVAAGRVRTNKTALGKTFNGLTADVTGQTTGVVLVTFTGYVNPGDGTARNYVIKALPEALIPSAPTTVAAPPPVAVSIAFQGYTATGFTLIATNNGVLLSASDMAKLVLQIEVSQF
jgi:hypothetical protein